MRVLYNGITLAGYDDRKANHSERAESSRMPILGFFARMCRDKGLDNLVDAYIILRERDRVKDLKLRVGGSCGPADESFVVSLKERLKTKGLLDEVEFVPNPDRAGKLDFLRSLTIFSVPARYGEAFGLYVVEALAAGVPVVLPKLGAFPELVEATGGGELCEPGNAASLADVIERLLLDPNRLRVLGERGRRAVFEKFSAAAMARDTVEIYRELISRSSQPSKAALQAK
jgi:glycosyltransferase involved in cell wall biosynthesis